MKLKVLLIFLFLFGQISFAQNFLGKWKTIDDETGKEKAIVEIFEKQGKIFGKIIAILEEEHRHRKCENCQGEDKNKPILGMSIIRGMKKNNAIYEGGNIIDPKNGKSYSCKISLDGKDKLIVRGYIGISLFGRSQTWVRQK
jgi:uncharacterized protein (DUF2147 family)